MVPSSNDILNPQIDSVPDYISPGKPATSIPSLPLQQESSIDPHEIYNNIDRYFQQKTQPDNYDYKPMYFDWDATRADRYTNSQYLHDVGFKPDAGPLNEQNYAAAQPAYKAVWNTLAGSVVNAWNGAKNQLETWPDTFSALVHGDIGKAFQTDELDQINKKQVEFQNNFPVYQSDPSGESLNWRSFGQSVQSFAALPGAILEMGAEQLGIGALTAATLGGTSELGGVEAVRAAQSAQNLSRILDQTANVKKAYQEFLQSKSLAEGWDLVKQTSAIVGSGLEKSGVEHLPLIGNLANFTADALNPGKSLGLVKTSINGFHAFYSDLRDLNLGISMGQGSAASTYQSILQKEQDDFHTKILEYQELFHEDAVSIFFLLF